jgi:hypothetical protein
MKKEVLLISASLLLFGCQKKEAVANVTFDSARVAAAAERISVVHKILPWLALPIVDAQYHEERVGNNSLGPAEAKFFLKVIAAPEKLYSWQRGLKPVEQPTEWVEPTAKVVWWPVASEAVSLRLYSVENFDKTQSGFIAVNANGTVFVFTQTR